LASGPSAALATDDLDRARRFFAPDEILGPAAFVDGRVKQLGSGVGFVVSHSVAIIAVAKGRGKNGLRRQWLRLGSKRPQGVIMMREYPLRKREGETGCDRLHSSR